jgi:hypothetical protein
MPELDLALIADHVSVEGGVAYVMRGCIDTVTAPELPAARNVGLLFRVQFSRIECGRPHRIEVIFQGEDGERLMGLETVVTPEWEQSFPPHWRVKVLAGLNFGVPLPRHGNYAFHVLINDSEVKVIDLRVVAPPQARIADAGPRV